MRRTLAALLGLAVVLGAPSALADNKYACCEPAAGHTSASCIAQPGSCSLPATGGAELALYWADFRSDGWEVDGDIPPWLTCNEKVTNGATCPSGWYFDPPLHPGELDGSFPDGTIGYLEWQAQPDPAWTGVCLLAPSADDPMHENATEPGGCWAFSLAPGAGAETLRLDLAPDPRWDGYELCYGAAPCNAGQAGVDPTIGATPGTGACCAPAHTFATGAVALTNGGWEIGLGQAVPGVPPPVLAYLPDGGIDYAWEGDADTFGPPVGCLPGYHEPANCGAPPPAPASDPPDAGDSAASGGGGGGGCAIAAPSAASLPAYGALVLGYVARRRRLKRAA
jgi:hypothetical protein